MPSSKVTIALTIDHINLILNALDQLPHKDVREAFDEVLNQANEQVTVKLQIPSDIEPAEERE